jgi:exodeoxyribonuclease VII large subunit
MKSPVVLTVTQLNTYVKSLLDGDSHLMSAFVCGEISNFTDHYKSGHFYFSLKDDKCVIKAVMFAPQARRLRFAPQDGMRVIVRGRVSVYEQNGQYQLYIEDMQPDGLGALNLAYEQLKNKLAAEGLFDQQCKKPLPKYPSNIGVITSPTGAAVHDIEQVLARRYPLAQIIFCPVLVQGEDAAPQLVAAIERFNRLDCADVIILGRGGGSIEDLWPFNEEKVARAVAASHIPIISAVGHETDFTICDFVADLRAPTPSAAAELAVPNIDDLRIQVLAYQATLQNSMRLKLSDLNRQIESLTLNRSFQIPQEQIELQRMKTDNLVNRMTSCMRKDVSESKAQLSHLSGKLDALSPLQVLARGYAIAYDADNHVLTQANDTAIGSEINLLLHKGRLQCIVKEKTVNDKKGGQLE